MMTSLDGDTTFGSRLVPGTHLPCRRFDSHVALARDVAEQAAAVIGDRNAAGQQAVLGVDAASMLLGVYRRLIDMHRHEGLDLSGCVVFGCDEYFGLDAESLQSRRRWLDEQFLAHVNIPADHVHLLDGTVPLEAVADHCRDFEAAIERAGGIDVQLLAVGPGGRIAFNEPFSVRHSRTRLATLDPLTRKDAASEFFNEEHVPPTALTMGIDTLLQARKVLVVALGEGLAPVVREAAEGPLSDRVPASFVRDHGDCQFLLDAAAAGALTGVATPWVLGNVEWNDARVKWAVLWLCQQTGKALLKLDDDDFRRHGLHQLLRHHGPAQTLAHRVFRWMGDTIEYHPAGREPRRIICFSPHPDDDVISMGGTLIRLVEDGHEVHVAYMTSGNIAVFDHDARRLADLVAEFNRRFGIEQDRSGRLESEVRHALAEKTPGQPDSDTVLAIKALIRWSEARSAAVACGCRDEHLHFLDLPFYRTGTIAKRPVSDADVAAITRLLDEVEPAQIYVAGDLSDPHGTHRMCAEAIFAALAQRSERGLPLPEVMLYRGAWQEWPLHELEVVVPLSPRDLELKKAAIFRHESQKDAALFPGVDSREFWQRAEERNRNTADLYNQLGLPEYFALEGFVRWDGKPL